MWARAAQSARGEKDDTITRSLKPVRFRARATARVTEAWPAAAWPAGTARRRRAGGSLISMFRPPAPRAGGAPRRGDGARPGCGAAARDPPPAAAGRLLDLDVQAAPAARALQR